MKNQQIQEKDLNKYLYWGMDKDTKSVYPWDKSTIEWSIMMSNIPKIGDDYIDIHHVSTVFLGINYCYDGGPPILFETMVFSTDQDYNDYQIRYHTYDEALKGHEQICKQIGEEKPLNPRKKLKFKF